MTILRASAIACSAGHAETSVQFHALPIRMLDILIFNAIPAKEQVASGIIVVQC